MASYSERIIPFRLRNGRDLNHALRSRLRSLSSEHGDIMDKSVNTWGPARKTPEWWALLEAGRLNRYGRVCKEEDAPDYYRIPHELTEEDYRRFRRWGCLASLAVGKLIPNPNRRS